MVASKSLFCLMPQLFVGHCRYKPSAAHEGFGELGWFFLERLSCKGSEIFNTGDLV